MQAVELSQTGNERIAMGGNQPPEMIIFGEIDAYYDEARNWASDGFAIESQEQADQIDTVDKALLKLAQEADALRVEEKRPLDEQIDAIQTKFNPYIQKGKGKVDTARTSLKALLTAWRAEQQRQKDEEARRIREEAEAAERAAQQAFQQTNVADLEEREEAERLAARAAELAKQAKKADKAATTGTGLRTKWVAEMVDQRTAVSSMWKQNPQSFLDLAQNLADAAVRNGARQIDGFNIKEEKVAI
jgi:hypothetical protein